MTVINNSSENFGLFKKIWYRFIYIWSHVTVEPVVALASLCERVRALTIQNLNLDKACLANLNYGEEICSAIMKGQNLTQYKTQQINGQNLVSEMQIWSNFIAYLFPSFLLLFIGPYSDKHKRRKPFVVLPIVGYVVMSIGLLFSSIYLKELPLYYNGILESIVPGLCGYWIVLAMSLYTYISSITTLSNRTFRIGIITTTMNIFHLLGSSISGVLINYLGYIKIFILLTIIYSLCLFYSLYCLKEVDRSNVNIIQNNNNNNIIIIFIKDFFNLNNVKETLTFLFKNNKLKEINKEEIQKDKQYNNKQIKQKEHKYFEEQYSNQYEKKEQVKKEIQYNNEQSNIIHEQQLQEYQIQEQRKEQVQNYLKQKEEQNDKEQFEEIYLQEQQINIQEQRTDQQDIESSNDDNKHIKIILIMLCVVSMYGPYGGELSVLYLYTRYVFHWTEYDYSFFYSIFVFTDCFGSTFTIIVFTKLLKLSDSMVGVIAVISTLAGEIVLAFAPTTFVFNCGPLAYVFSTAAFIAMRAIISKLTTEEEMGKTMAGFMIFEGFSPMLFNPLYSGVYRITINSMPNIFLFMSFILTIPALLIFLWIYIQDRKILKKNLNLMST